MGSSAHTRQSVFTAPATGRPEVDSILSGTFWSSSGSLGKPGILTYSFISPSHPQSLLPMSFTEWMEPDYAALTPEFKSVISQALSRVTELTKLSFVPADAGQDGNIIFGITGTPASSVVSPTAYALEPHASQDEAFVWLNRWTTYDYDKAEFGDDRMLIVLHEIGHGLGLRHPHDTDVAYGFMRNTRQDAETFSVMSYQAYLGAGSQGGSVERKPLSYMVNDIAALQYLYGQNMQTRRGDDVYAFSSDAYVYQTIWDAGGLDTISWSGQLTSADISLQPGTLSYFGGVDERTDPATWPHSSGILGIAYDCDIESAEGGDGADRLKGNSLDNILLGGPGEDVLVASAGHDTLDGGSGEDTADYSQLDGTFSVRLVAGEDVQVVFNGTAKDTLRHIEHVIGGRSSDVLIGDDAANTLIGHSGDDVLSGGGGHDLLEGGLGRDRLRGGEGADIFVYRALYDSPTSDELRDVIIDFQEAAGDRIDLSALDTQPDMSGMQVPVFSATGPQSHAVWYEVQDSGGTVHVETSGDSVPDMSIDLKNVSTLSQHAFRLVNSPAEEVFPSIDEGVSSLVSSVDADPVRDDLVTDQATRNEAATRVDGPGVPAYRTVYGTIGDDRLEGGWDNNTFGSTSGRDIIHGHGGADTMSYRGEVLPVSVTLRGTNPVSVTLGGHAKDTLQDIENLTGGRGGDLLTGDHNVNILMGKEGNDHLSGGGGNDCLAGEDGADRLVGGLGDDTLDGGPGHDIADYGHRTEPLYALLRGSLWGGVDVADSEQDRLVQIEELIAGSGDDALVVWGHGTTVTGGAGADTFMFEPMPQEISSSFAPLQENIVRDFRREEGDCFDISGTSLSEWVSVWSDTGPAAHAVWTVADGGDSLLYADYDGDARADVLVRLKGVSDVRPEDILLASEVPLTVSVPASSLQEETSSIIVDLDQGTVTVRGRVQTLDPQPTLVTGFGDDMITIAPPATVGASVTHVDAGSGVDRLDFSRVRQSVEIFLKDDEWGFAVGSDGVVWHIRNAENIIGTFADDHLIGNADDNTLSGFYGRDVLDGEDGHDTVNYAYSTQGISVTLARDQWAEVTVGGASEDEVRNIESVIGSRGQDTVTGDSQDNTYTWVGGDATFDGKDGNDTFVFLDATADISVTLNGDQWVTIDVQGHTNRMRDVESVTGGHAHDRLVGDSRANILNGDGGDDWLQGGLGEDTLIGGQGRDTADYSDRAESVAVTLHGKYTAVVFIDDQAEDRIQSIENINGGRGDDRLSGDSLSNVLSGGEGRDLLGGGGGSDRFVWTTVQESPYGNPDTVTDFASHGNGGSGDVLDLSAVDANSGEEGHQALVFSGQTVQAYSVWYHVNDDDHSSMLYADISGDSLPEFAVLLRGVTTLSASDLVL